MKRVKWSIAIAFLLIFLVGIGYYRKERNKTNVLADYWKYPIESDSWNAMDAEARIDACRIPEEILTIMTAEQLVQAVLDFPYNIDVSVSSSIETGLERLENQSDAYKELLSRDDAKRALLAKLEKMSQSAQVTTEEEWNMNLLYDILFYEEQFQESFSEDERKHINGILEKE